MQLVTPDLYTAYTVLPRIDGEQCHTQTHPLLETGHHRLHGPILGQDKTPKASPKKRSIMEHSPGLPQGIKSLRSCSGNLAKMPLKGYLGITCHSQYYNVKITPLHYSITTPLLFIAPTLLHYTSLLGAVLYNALHHHCIPLHIAALDFTAQFITTLYYTVYHNTLLALQTTVC